MKRAPRYGCRVWRNGRVYQGGQWLPRERLMTEGEWLTCDDPGLMLRWLDGETTDLRPGAVNPLPGKVTCRKLRLFGLGLYEAYARRGEDYENDPERYELIIRLSHDWIDEGTTSIEGMPRWNLTMRKPHQFAVDSIEAYTLAGFTPSRPIRSRRLREEESQRLPLAEAAAILREIVGNPFRPVELPSGPKPAKKLHQCPDCRLPGRFCAKCHGTTKVEAACGWCLDTGQVWTGMDGMKWVPCVHCPKPAPCPWLTWNDGTVARLAESIYQSRSYDQCPILADALEEAGCDHQEILASLRRENAPWCRGSWVLDLLTNRS